MRCADCGASNADSADWCGQCYAPFATAESVPSPAPAAPAPEGSAAPEPGEPGEPTAEGFRRHDGTVEWQCPDCGEWSAVVSLRCAVCGQTIAARWERADPDRAAAAQRLSEPWTAALALTAVVPGAGHIGLGRYGPGFARAVLFAVWVAGGVALWRAGGALAGGPFLLGAGVLWAGSLADIAALRSGRRELLGGRSLLWLVVGTLALALLGVFAAASGATAPGVAGVG